MPPYHRLLILYGIWSSCSIGFALLLAGLTPDSITRLLVLAFLVGQWLSLPLLKHIPHHWPLRNRFMGLAILLAAVLEGFHMISKPVFASLLIRKETPLSLALTHYGIDLLFTIPAYLVIFWIIWLFISRNPFPLWHYIFIVGVAQMLGDGGLAYFCSAPWMLVFLPYPLSNYHAMNILPFLAIRDHLHREGPASPRVFLALPTIVLVYFVCGSVIQILGNAWNLR